jgi:predicted  nucleic acid-binding Zn-ribbon protein
VAIAEKGRCLGCRVGLPPQQLIELRRGTGLVACHNCTRILVLAEHP